MDTDKRRFEILHSYLQQGMGFCIHLFRNTKILLCFVIKRSNGGLYTLVQKSVSFAIKKERGEAQYTGKKGEKIRSNRIIG